MEEKVKAEPPKARKPVADKKPKPEVCINKNCKGPLTCRICAMREAEKSRVAGDTKREEEWRQIGLGLMDTERAPLFEDKQESRIGTRRHVRTRSRNRAMPRTR